jgi:hypothetical protein
MKRSRFFRSRANGDLVPAQRLRPTSSMLLRISKDLRSHPRPVKLLQMLFNASLKRLASAVQLRPWPPCLQSLRKISSSHPCPCKHVILGRQQNRNSKSLSYSRSYSLELALSAEFGKLRLALPKTGYSEGCGRAIRSAAARFRVDADLHQRQTPARIRKPSLAH